MRMELTSHEVLAELMAHARHTVRSLAAEAGTSPATIGSLSAGNRPTCRGDLGVRIERVLNVLPGTLFRHVSDVSRLMRHETVEGAPAEVWPSPPSVGTGTGDLPRLTWTVAEISAMTGINQKVLRREIRSKKLGSIRPGGKYFVPDIELKRYLAKAQPERVSA